MAVEGGVLLGFSTPILCGNKTPASNKAMSLACRLTTCTHHPVAVLLKGGEVPLLFLFKGVEKAI